MDVRTIISWILMVSIVFLVMEIVRNSYDMSQAEKRLTQAREKVALLEQQNRRLTVDSDKRNTESYIEEQIRNKFNLAKPGETVVFLPPELSDEVEQQQFYYQIYGEEKEPISPAWQDWMGLFF